MPNNNPLTKINLKNPIHFLAVGFGSGLTNFAPGTWGSLVGLLFGAVLLSYLPIQCFVMLIAIGFIAGVYICQKTSDDMGVHDHGAIVWDEIAAMFIVLLAIPSLSFCWLLTAFLLFRFFDILKPYPICYFDKRLESGFGIMIDDVLAAIYSVLVLLVLRQIF